MKVPSMLIVVLITIELCSCAPAWTRHGFVPIVIEPRFHSAAASPPDLILARE